MYVTYMLCIFLRETDYFEINIWDEMNTRVVVWWNQTSHTKTTQLNVFITTLKIWQATFWSHGYSLLFRHVTEEIT